MTGDILASIQRGDLTYEEARRAAAELLSGSIPARQAADFLEQLARKGETDDELLAMLDVMQENSLKVEHAKNDAVDVCGTGGDGLGTFNISTTAAFVAASAGVPVAKHGNRSSSGVSGSADIFEYLGYDMNQGPQDVAGLLDEFNVCFMFAQKFHPAMKNVSAARRMLKTPTAFNILGPLSNPAGVKRQLVGVSTDELLERLPRLLQKKGAKKIMTVRSQDGMDEFSAGCKNHTCLLDDNAITASVIDPQELGLRKASAQDLLVGTIPESAKAFVQVLDGEANQSMTDTVVLNAAAAIIVGGKADDFKEGVSVAKDAIRSGRTSALLEKFIEKAGSASILREVRES